MDKKKLQLGMNPSTASHRLVKDLLWFFICQTKDGVNCHRCGQMMDRDTFSIEHKTPWLDSDDPVGLYFNLANVDFSHKSCNYAAKRIPHKKYYSEEARLAACAKKTRDKWRELPKEEQQRIRRDKYLRNGK